MTNWKIELLRSIHAYVETWEPKSFWRKILRKWMLQALLNEIEEETR